MLTALVMAGLAVVIEGDTTCPSPARVSEATAALLAGVEARAEPHRVRLAERGGAIVVELSSARDRLLQRRTFPRGASCDDLASAIAVVIATWEVELGGAVAVAVNVTVAAAAASSDELRDEAATTTSVSTPTLRPRAATTTTTTTTTTTATTTTTFSAGLAALGTVDGSGNVAGALAEIDVARGPWTFRLAAATTARRDADLAPGSVHWRRSAAAFGVKRQLLGSPRSAAGIEVGADLLLGLIAASGDGFTEDRTSFSFAPGIGPLVRATLLRRGRWAWYLEAADWIWLRRGQLGVTGLNGRAYLPRHEVRGAIGIRIELGDP